MRCVYPNCNLDSNQISRGITYQTFPTEPSLRAAWLESLHKINWEPDENSAVCSQHFLDEDLLRSSSGCVVRAGAVPVVDVRICRICLTTDCKLYPMTAYKVLSNIYETLTGLLIQNEKNLPPYLCYKCTRRSLSCAHFRTTSLQAHLILQKIVKNHGYIKLESIHSAEGIQSSLHSNQIDCNGQTNHDLDMELTEIEKVCSDQNARTKFEDVAVDCIKSEIADVSIGCVKSDIDNVGIDCIKIEIVDMMDQDIDNVKEKTNNDTVSTVPEDVAQCEVKTEHSVTNHNSCNEDSSKATMVHGNVFVGEDYSSDDNLLLVETRQKVELSSTAVQQVMKVLKDPPKVKIDTHRSSIAEGRIRIPNTLSCDICPYQTSYKLHLLNHVKAHTAAKSYNCNVCSYITVSKQSLKLHAKKHSGEKPYSCHICSKAFTQKAHFTTHLKTHFGDKPYSCDICNKVFNQKAHLTRHLRTHSGEKPYSCRICNKVFSDRSNFTTHLRTHSGEKPYLCSVCNKAFNRKDAFTRHWRIHSGEKPYSCKICNKEFNDKSNLTIHLRSHSGKKPHSCDICNKAFNRKPHLTRHLRTHSSEKPFSHTTGDIIK